jgi:TatD DNase family protein
MFDTHCHLYIDPLLKSLDEIILKSFESGVKYLMVPGVDFATSQKSIEISNCYENVFAAVGIHPTTIIEKEQIDKSLYKIEESIQKEKVMAVGEIGLDYYHKFNSESTQKELFDKQLKIAVKYNKSVIVHSRHSSEDVISVIKHNNPKNFSKSLVFYCAEPVNEILDFVLENNYFIGIDGDITFDKDKQIFVKKIPLKNIVFETDSPYLAPTEDGKKDRDKINYPYYLKKAIEKVAEIKNIEVDFLIKETNKNAHLLFGIPSGYN